MSISELWECDIGHRCPATRTHPW